MLQKGYVIIERGLAEGSVLSPRLYTIFLADLLTKLQHKFPNLTCRGESGYQWIGATA